MCSGSSMRAHLARHYSYRLTAQDRLQRWTAHRDEPRGLPPRMGGPRLVTRTLNCCGRFIPAHGRTTGINPVARSLGRLGGNGLAHLDAWVVTARSVAVSLRLSLGARASIFGATLSGSVLASATRSCALRTS